MPAPHQHHRMTLNVSRLHRRLVLTDSSRDGDADTVPLFEMQDSPNARCDRDHMANQSARCQHANLRRRDGALIVIRYRIDSCTSLPTLKELCQ